MHVSDLHNQRHLYRYIALTLSVFVTLSVLPQAASSNESSVIATITSPYSGTTHALGFQGLSLSKDGKTLYVAGGMRMALWNSTFRRCDAPAASRSPTGGGRGEVVLFDLENRKYLRSFPTDAGYPIHVQLDRTSGRIFVVNSPGGVMAFDGQTNTVNSGSLGGAPHDIGIASGLGRGLVSNTYDTSGIGRNQKWVTLIDLNTLRIIQHIETGPYAHKVAIDSRSNRAFVTHAEYSEVEEIDLKTGKVISSIKTGLLSGGAQNAIDEERRRFYTLGRGIAQPSDTSQWIVAFDLESGAKVGTAELPNSAIGTRVDGKTGYLWTAVQDKGAVYVTDPTDMKIVARIPVGECPYFLDIDSAQGLVYVTNQGDNTISIIDINKVTYRKDPVSPQPSPTPAPVTSPPPAPAPVQTVAPLPSISATPLPTAIVSPSPSTSRVKRTNLTITCIKGGKTKKIKGMNPKCPKGYKKK